EAGAGGAARGAQRDALAHAPRSARRAGLRIRRLHPDREPHRTAGHVGASLLEPARPADRLPFPGPLRRRGHAAAAGGPARARAAVGRSAAAALVKPFALEARGTTVAREVRGGVATFLAMAYILFANPAILGAAGMPFAP